MGRPRSLLRDIGIDAAGVTTVAFDVSDRFNRVVDVFVTRYDGAWTAPDRVSLATGFNGGEPMLAVEAGGDFLVGWRDCVAVCAVTVRAYRGGTWDAPVRLANVNSTPVVAVSQGHALAIWPVSQSAVWASAINDGTWSPPLLLEKDVDNSQYAFAVTLRRGHAGLAAWTRQPAVPAAPLNRVIATALYLYP